MRSDISEFSYGFALTREICAHQWGKLRAAPVFPSLIAEGRAGGGYDMHIDFPPGYPLYIQFKISERMMRASAGQWDSFSSPYYRFWIHDASHSKQHELLCQLDSDSAIALYAAPVIRGIQDLNQAFVNETVVNKSAFFRPRDVGPINDQKSHCIAFQPDCSFGYFCSEPRKVTMFSQGPELFEKIVSTFEGRERISSEEHANRNLALLRESFPQLLTWHRTDVEEQDPRQVFAYLVRTLLGAEWLWIS